VKLFFGKLAGRQTDAEQAEILDVKTALEQKYEIKIAKMAFFKQWEQDVVRSPDHHFLAGCADAFSHPVVRSAWFLCIHSTMVKTTLSQKVAQKSLR
jgi:hypothetical protein